MNRPPIQVISLPLPLHSFIFIAWMNCWEVTLFAVACKQAKEGS